MEELLLELQNKIGYRFNDVDLLIRALTHPSCGDVPNYERLEFLGDAVIELIISDYLFTKYSDFSEGVLTQRRADIVCSKSLARIARNIDLGNYIFLGNGEEMSGGRNKTSILENAMEALIGAVYMDGGFYATQSMVNVLFHNAIKEVMTRILDRDYKSQLQEMVQKTVKKEINYLVNRQEGPPHNTTFYVRLIIGSEVVCEGVGSSKKEAEQNAAKFAIANFDKIYKE
ncbi:MAG: ribonuclease III [Christensenella sp.]|nr:ribonuclease III [Christensenella sp.]